jgi:hypothetical protein
MNSTIKYPRESNQTFEVKEEENHTSNFKVFKKDLEICFTAAISARSVKNHLIKLKRKNSFCETGLSFPAREAKMEPGPDALSPNLRTPNSGFNPGITPFYITNAGGGSRVKPGVRHPEMWALVLLLLT